MQDKTNSADTGLAEVIATRNCGSRKRNVYNVKKKIAVSKAQMEPEKFFLIQGREANVTETMYTGQKHAGPEK